MSAQFSDQSMVPEEPWEAEIAAVLGNLPTIDPPAGFIAGALDHRPLFAGRLLVGLALGVVVAFGASLAVGAFGRPLVVPELGALSAQHAMTQAGVLSAAPADSEGFHVAEEAIDSPLDTSAELDLRATLIGERELRQAVYARQGESISIFSQPGRVKFDELPDGDRVMIDGVLAWVDPGEKVVVLETAESAVTIMGLTPDEVAQAVQDIPRRSSTASVTDVLNGITRELGFPDLN